MIKIQTGSLHRATAAWRLSNEILKETEARHRAGVVNNHVNKCDRPAPVATQRPPFMALSFLRCP
jgi:hypothetical protein